jgi:hypothetical protein
MPDVIGAGRVIITSSAVMACHAVVAAWTARRVVGQ